MKPITTPPFRVHCLISETGKQIGEVNRSKQNGELNEVEAAEKISELELTKKDYEFKMNLVRLLDVTPEEVSSGVLFNEKRNPTKVEISAVVGELLARSGDEGLEALQQLSRMLESFNQNSSNKENLIATDTDDFGTTLAIGANPVGSCQHYETGQYRLGLFSYFDPAAKIVTIKGENGAFLSRAVLRLAEGIDKQPVLVLEPTYSSVASGDAANLVTEHAKTKAEKMGVDLYVQDTGSGLLSQMVLQQQVSMMATRSPAAYSDLFDGFRFGGEQAKKSSNSKNLIKV